MNPRRRRPEECVACSGGKCWKPGEFLCSMCMLFQRNDTEVWDQERASNNPEITYDDVLNVSLEIVNYNSKILLEREKNVKK